MRSDKRTAIDSNCQGPKGRRANCGFRAGAHVVENETFLSDQDGIAKSEVTDLCCDFADVCGILFLTLRDAGLRSWMEIRTSSRRGWAAVRIMGSVSWMSMPSTGDAYGPALGEALIYMLVSS